jgi:hypothetical protein
MATKRRSDTTIVQVKLRIREGLRKKLLKEAEKAGRSVNQELERRLERSFELEQRLKEKEQVGMTLAVENQNLKQQLDAMQRKAAVARRHKFDLESSQHILDKLDDISKLLGG